MHEPYAVIAPGIHELALPVNSRYFNLSLVNNIFSDLHGYADRHGDYDTLYVTGSVKTEHNSAIQIFQHKVLKRIG